MKKLLLFGGSGLVGSKFIELFSQDLEIIAPDVSEIDILNKEKVLKAVEQADPDTVINFAAYTNVEEAEKQKDDKNGICYQINTIGAKNVAEAAKDFKKHLVHISTEYVFNGTKEEAPYTEEDKPNPINWYGQTKLFGEEFVLNSEGINTIVRICMPFSPYYQFKKDVVRFFLGELQAGNNLTAIEDQRVTPTLVADIAQSLKVIVDVQTPGLYHVSSTDSVTPLELAKTIAELFGLNYSLISPISLDEYNKKKNAKLLRFSWLNPTKFERQFGEGILHTVEEGLIIFKKEIDERITNQL